MPNCAECVSIVRVKKMSVEGESVEDAKKDLTTCNIMKALKKRHISDVRVFLMIHLEIPFHKVQEFTCSQHSNHDWILIQGLEYWLRNYKKPSWETLATALEASGDSKTAAEIRQTYTVEEDNYVDLIPHPVCSLQRVQDEELERLDTLKMKTTTAYNSAMKTVEKFHFDIQHALRTEQDATTKSLHKQNLVANETTNCLFTRMDVLTKETTSLETELQHSLERLEVGDSLALATLEKAQRDCIKMEGEIQKIEKDLAKYQQTIPTSVNSLSTSERVLQDLQAILKVQMKLTTDDEEIYEKAVDMQ